MRNPGIRKSTALLQTEVRVVKVGAAKLPDADGRVIREFCRMERQGPVYRLCFRQCLGDGRRDWCQTCPRREPAEIVAQVPQRGIGRRDVLPSYPCPADIQPVASVELVLECDSIIFFQAILGPCFGPQIADPELDEAFGFNEGENVFSLCRHTP